MSRNVNWAPAYPPNAAASSMISVSRQATDPTNGKAKDSDGVCGSHQHNLNGIHRPDIGEAKQTPNRHHHDPHCASKVAAIDAQKKLRCHQKSGIWP